MAGSSGKGGDYWPGFVDALTNVVIAMVFVIVVLAIALSFSAQKVAQAMTTKIKEQEVELARARADAAEARASAAAMASAQAAPAAAAQAQAAAARAPAARTEDARLPVQERIAVAGNEGAANAAGVTLKSATNTLLLEFGPGAITLDSAATTRLREVLQPLRAALAAPGARLIVAATGPEMQLSDNQRAAYIRAMSVRNVLIAEGVDAARISPRVDTGTGTPQPTVSIRLEAAP